jgi:hypothetical protein
MFCGTHRYAALHLHVKRLHMKVLALIMITVNGLLSILFLIVGLGDKYDIPLLIRIAGFLMGAVCPAIAIYYIGQSRSGLAFFIACLPELLFLLFVIAFAFINKRWN